MLRYCANCETIYSSKPTGGKCTRCGTPLMDILSIKLDKDGTADLEVQPKAPLRYIKISVKLE
jgi:rRNA maturation endonuclease Nob1